MLKDKGVKMIVLIILAVTTAGMSKNAPTPKTRISALDPAVFKIAPLNENSANSIEASGLGQLMSRPDKQMLDFQTKVKTVGDQM